MNTVININYRLVVAAVVFSIMCVVPASVHAAEKTFFTVQPKKVTLGNPVVVSWSVPQASHCYLYSPASQEPNVPDEFFNSATTTLTFSKEASDGGRGKTASITLVCQDHSKVDRKGNFVQVFDKKIMVRLSAAKGTKSSGALKGLTTPYIDNLGSGSFSISAPEGWRYDPTGEYDSVTFTSPDETARIVLLDGDLIDEDDWQEIRAARVGDVHGVEKILERKLVTVAGSKALSVLVHSFENRYIKYISFEYLGKRRVVAFSFATKKAMDANLTIMERSVATLQLKNTIVVTPTLPIASKLTAERFVGVIQNKPVSILPPLGWRTGESSDGMFMGYGDPERGAFIAITRHVSFEEEIYQSSLSSMAMETRLQQYIPEIKKTTVGGLTAYKIERTTTNSRKEQDYYIPKNGALYVVTVSAPVKTWNQYWVVIEKSLKTLRLP